MSRTGDPLRVLVIAGTRPETIKLAPILLAARDEPGIDARLMSTGQHHEIHDEVLRLFGLEAGLRVDVMRPGQSLPRLSARCLELFEPALVEARPHLVVVQGDTTSAAMGALSAFYAGTPVWHVEAGLRTSTPHLPFPEEMNRRLITRLAARHLAATERAKANLLVEGIDESTIEVTGNTGIDALLAARGLRDRFADDRLERTAGSDHPLLVVTTHRRENWGPGIRRVAAAERDLVERFPDLRVVHAAHPNPAVRADIDDVIGGHDRVHVADPIDYGDFVRLLARATVIVTDSGGIQEEAPSLDVPVLVAREETERVEGLQAGLSRLVGTDRALIVDEVSALLTDPAARAAMTGADNPYGDGRAAERIVGLMRAQADRLRPADALA
jgi:UDP-N-acetylglucosamine 2-epimerase